MIFVQYPGHLVAALIVGMVAALLVAAYCSPGPAKAKRWRPLLWLLQCVAAMILLLILWNPSRPEMKEEFKKNTVLVYYDTSQSMSIDQSEGISRLDTSLMAFDNIFSPSNPDRPNYQFYGFDQDLYPVSSAGSLRRWGSQTNLHSIMNPIVQYSAMLNSMETQSNQERKIVGAVVFTDGQAANKNVRSYVALSDRDFKTIIVGVGNQRPAPDIQVKSLSVPLQAAIGTSYTVNAHIETRYLDAGVINVEICKNDFVVDTKILQRRDWMQGANVDFVLTASGLGRDVITVRAKGVGSESNIANNERTSTIEVIESTKLKVLFYSQVANHDIGKVRQALVRDKKVDLDFGLDAIISQELAGNAMASCGHFKLPNDLEEFYKYDVIVLGPCALDALETLQIEGLYRFVSERGGGLIVLPGFGAYGPSAVSDNRLRTLLPVVFDSDGWMNSDLNYQKADLTLEGLTSGLLDAEQLGTEARYSALYYQDMQKKPAARTLLTVSGQPLVCTHRVGRGRVCIINSNRLFRWYREDLNGGLLHKFFAGLTGYVGRVRRPEANVDLFAERHPDRPDSVTFEARVRNVLSDPVSDADVIIDVDGLLIKMEETEEGRYIAQAQGILTEAVRASVQAQKDGVFLGERTIAVNLPIERSEMDNTELDREFLAALSERVGCEYYDIGELNNEICREFDAKTRIERLNSMQSVWPRWPLFIGVCSLLTASWFIRRAVGLV